MTMHAAPAAPLFAPLSPPSGGRLRLRCRRAMRDAAAAAAIVCLASVVAYAEVTLQDWIPEALTLPDDAEVVTDREIGSTVRMFSVSTDVAVGPLLADWEEALRTGGYDIESNRDELVEDAIEFSGPGITNAKIVATRTDDDGRSLIEFDATLD